MNNETVHAVVIDDEAAIRVEVVKILEREGYSYHQFDSAATARDGVAELTPNLIISDIQSGRRERFGIMP